MTEVKTVWDGGILSLHLFDSYLIKVRVVKDLESSGSNWDRSKKFLWSSRKIRVQPYASWILCSIGGLLFKRIWTQYELHSFIGFVGDLESQVSLLFPLIDQPRFHGKEWLSEHHLRDNATYRPDIYRIVIVNTS